MNPNIVIFTARLEQQNLVAGLGTKPIGDDATRATRTNDDVVELAEDFV